MADEVENHTIKLLQEMRSEIREMHADLTERLKTLSVRAGGYAILLEMVAGLVSNHQERIGKLERGRT